MMRTSGHIHWMVAVVLGMVVCSPQARAQTPIERAATERGPGSMPSGIGWCRKGTVYFTGEDGDSVVVDVRPIHPYQPPLRLTAPDGRVAWRTQPVQRRNQTHRIALSSGSGVYRLVLKLPALVRITAPNAEKLVLRADRESVAFFTEQRAAAQPFYCRPPSGRSSMTLVMTNQRLYECRGARVAVNAVGGEQRFAARLPSLNKKGIGKRFGIPPAHMGTTDDGFSRIIRKGEMRLMKGFGFVVDSVQLEGSRFWEVRVKPEGDPWAYVGLWGSECACYLAPDPSKWFEPHLDTANASIQVTGSRQVGTLPCVGTVWTWRMSHSYERERREFGRMGLNGVKTFVNHSACEPVNDNSAPDSALARGFRFESRLEDGFTRMQRSGIVDRILIAVTDPAPWLRKLEKADHPLAVREFAEFCEAVARYLVEELELPPERLYLQFHNEPNHIMEADHYLDYVAAIGKRLKASRVAGVRSIRIAAPGLGNPYGQPTLVDRHWIRCTLERAGDVVDAVVWNQYSIEDMEDTRLYAQAIDTTMAIMRRYRGEGARRELIIGATNMRGGVCLQHEKQDGWYAGLWWVASLAAIANTGHVAMVNYFLLHDVGAYRKGLLFEDGGPKPVAEAMAFFSEHTCTDVVAARSDHGAVDALATKTAKGDTVRVICINRAENVIDTDLRIEGAPKRPLVQGWCIGSRDGNTSVADVAVSRSKVGDAFRVVLPPMSATAVLVTGQGKTDP